MVGVVTIRVEDVLVVELVVVGGLLVVGAGVGCGVVVVVSGVIVVNVVVHVAPTHLPEAWEICEANANRASLAATL